MKLLHLSDLHLGKRVHEFSLLEDQRYILNEIVSLCDERRPDAVLIAGDVYDRAVPSAEAVELLDDFLTALAQRGLVCLIIGGNHDSAERLCFGGRIFSKNGIHISGQPDSRLQSVTLSDRYGDVHFYLMPFLRPAEVRRFFPAELNTYEDAVRAVLEANPVNPAERNVLLAHQFFTAAGTEPIRSESETVSVGGLDQVDAAALEAFDYVALGHLHGPQSVGRAGVRYGGSPLKYSFSEAQQKKGATWVELGEKGSLSVELLPLVPLRDMREIRGPIAVLTDPAVYGNADTGDYIRAVLTDEDEVTDALGRLRAVYPNLMNIGYDNARTRSLSGIGTADATVQKSALELFRAFYLQQNGSPLAGEKERIVTDLFEQLGGEQL